MRRETWGRSLEAVSKIDEWIAGVLAGGDGTQKRAGAADVEPVRGPDESLIAKA